MSLIQAQPGSLIVLSASDWARLLAQGPTDVQAAPGSKLFVFPDSWGPGDVALVLRGSSAPPTPTTPPTGVPPAG